MAKTKVRAGQLPKNFDGSKECWHCGSKAMKPDERGYVCSACGATWIRLAYERTDVLAGKGTDKQYLKTLRKDDPAFRWQDIP